LKIKKNPMCEACDARGILIKPARHVHHVEPIDTEEGWAKRLVITNLQSLCLPCHNRVKRDTSGS
jgi:5-methylcytosine-specific restriction protein A